MSILGSSSSIFFGAELSPFGATIFQNIYILSNVHPPSPALFLAKSRFLTFNAKIAMFLHIVQAISQDIKRF
jgi:hypothetical protein